MAEKVRSKPSSLHRLVQTVAQRTLDTLTEKVRASGKNLEKLELTLFLRGLKNYDRKAETSFAEEKVGSDKAAEYLKRTKFQTMKFLISELALISPYPHQDLHFLIGQIRLMMHHAVFPDVLQVIDEAISIAKERELFFEWRQLLQFQLVAVQRCLFGKDVLARATETQEQIKDVSRKIDAIEKWENLKLETIIPLKAQHDQNREWKQELADSFELDELSKIPPQGVRPKIDYEEVWILILLHTKDIKRIWEHQQELLSIFARDKEISQEFAGEYARLLMRMIHFSPEFIEKDTALKTFVHPLAAMLDFDELTRALVLDKTIIGYYLFSRLFNDPRKANQASKLFEEEKDRLRDHLREEAYVQICYLYLYHKFELGDFQACKSLIEEIFRLGVEARVDLQCHFRTVLHLATYLSNTEVGNFGVSCSHTISFFVGKAAKIDVQLLVLRALVNCANKASNLSRREEIWQEAMDALNLFPFEPGGELEAFNYKSCWERNKNKIIQRQ